MTKRVLWGFVVLAAIIGLAAGLERMHIENLNKNVEITIDWAAAERLAAVSEQDLLTVLQSLREAGVHSAAILPRTTAEYGVAGYDLPASVTEEWLQWPQHREILAQQPVGFWPEDFALARQAGLAVVPRLANPPWPQDDIWQDLHEYEPHLVVFSGRDAAGYPDHLEETIVHLQTIGAVPGLIEFASQRGIETVGRAVPGVRVHGISLEEMKKLVPERVVARYLRGVRERNIRVIYFRGYTETAEDWPETLALLAALTEELETQGYHLGAAEPFAPWQVSPLLQWIAWVGLVAAVVILLSQWVVLSSWLMWLLLLTGWFGLGGLLWLRPHWAELLAALAAAIVFPTLAVLLIPSCPGRRLRMVAQTVLVSSVGALLVVLSLSGSEYLVKIAEFRGVKLMHLLPVVAAIGFGLLWKQLPVRRWHLLARRLDEIWEGKVPVKYLVMAAFVGVLGVVYIMRTGNFGLPAMEWEIRFRELLERVFLARPRTKELFLGHPALWWAGASVGRWSWWIPVAAIGQLSLVNTFTHIHTPLMISVLRTVYGLVLGLCLGWLLEVLWNRLLRRWFYDYVVRLLRVR